MQKVIPLQFYLNVVVLWIHLFAAAFFVGGSFFFWLVVIPASRLITNGEAERTLAIGKIAKKFGRAVTPTLIILILTGIYNASWYLSSYSALLTYPGTLLLTKMAIVIILVIFIYLHNVYFGKRIVALAREGKVEELKKIRKTSRVISAVNLTLMGLILLLAVLMQMT